MTEDTKAVEYKPSASEAPDEAAEAQARAEAAAHNPHAPPPHEDALIQRDRNMRGIADTVENRLLRLEAAVFPPEEAELPIEVEAGPLKAETADEAFDQG